MLLTVQQISSLDEESLRSFLEIESPEGFHLEFKVQSPGKSEKERKLKFLRSISGFANAAGGHLIIGVAEPSSAGSVASRIKGIEEGQELAHWYERLAAALVDPRIPGLRFEVVSLVSGKDILFVHVPASVSKPHMVFLDGRQYFFIRHSESTVPMSTHEIREAVFASASAEGRARNYLDRCEQDLKTYEVIDRHAFLMQAMPLISPDQPWPVLSDEMKEVVKGRASLTHFSTAYAPTPTLSGIKAFESRRGASLWITEVHRNGYISALYFDQPSPDQDQRERIFLTIVHCAVFGSFCDLCKRATQVAGIDSPYLVRCRYIGADMAVLGVEGSSGELSSESEPYGRKEIVWPEMIRSAGEDFANLAPEFCDLLYNTFGKEKSNWSQEST